MANLGLYSCKPEEKYSTSSKFQQTGVYEKDPFFSVFKVVKAYTLNGFL